MIHPKTELKFISNEVGNGVVATEFIPAGTIVWTLDKLDQIFSPAEFEAMEPLYKDILETYTFRNSQGQYILCWDNSRFFNHSFNPNCMTTAYEFEIAVRDIHPGEQLTDDYGCFNITQAFRAIDEGTKRKVVYPDDLLKYHKVWDKKLLSVFHLIPKLNQPLMPVLTAEVKSEIDAICAGKKEMDSILKNYYPQKNGELV